MINFLKEAQLELQKIQWPTRKQTIRLTSFVIGASLSVGLFVMLLDYLFKEGLSLIIR